LVTHVDSYMGLREAVREKTHTQPATHSPNHRTMVSALDKASAPPMPPLPPPPLKNNGGTIARGETSHFTVACDNYGGDEDEESPLPVMRVLTFPSLHNSMQSLLTTATTAVNEEEGQNAGNRKRLPKSQSDESPSPV
jgi:hypothetical protein